MREDCEAPLSPGTHQAYENEQVVLVSWKACQSLSAARDVSRRVTWKLAVSTTTSLTTMGLGDALTCLPISSRIHGVSGALLQCVVPWHRHVFAGEHYSCIWADVIIIQVGVVVQRLRHRSEPFHNVVHVAACVGGWSCGCHVFDTLSGLEPLTWR